MGKYKCTTKQNKKNQIHLLGISGNPITTAIHLTHQNLHIDIPCFSLLKRIPKPSLNTIGYHIRKRHSTISLFLRAGLHSSTSNFQMRVRWFRWIIESQRRRISGSQKVTDHFLNQTKQIYIWVFGNLTFLRAFFSVFLRCYLNFMTGFEGEKFFIFRTSQSKVSCRMRIKKGLRV